MTEPILDATRVVTSIGQGVPAPVAEHVGVNRKSEAGAIADALYQAVDGIVTWLTLWFARSQPLTTVFTRRLS